MVLNKYIFMRFTLFCHTTANDTYMCLCDHNHKTANDTYMCLCDHNHKTTVKAKCGKCMLYVYNEERKKLSFITFFFVCHFNYLQRHLKIQKYIYKDIIGRYMFNLQNLQKIYNATILNAPLITNTMLV